MRGRPTAATQHMDKKFSDMIRNMSPDRTTRNHATQFYCGAVYALLSEAASDIPYLDGIFSVTGTGLMEKVKEKTEIIEQLGRILEQDGYGDEDVLWVAKWAAKAYHDGLTVKEIKGIISKQRQIWREKEERDEGEKEK